MKNSISTNIWKMYLISFLTELFFFVPIFVPFLSSIGLSMREILFLEAVFAFTVAVLEIPSGYFSDICGRRLSMILSAIFAAIGVLIFVFFLNFWGFLFGEILFGIAMCFSSGSGEALIFDSLIEMNHVEKYKKIQGNMLFNARIGSVVANIAGGFFAMFFLKLPFYLTLLPFVISIPLTFSLIEPMRHKNEHEHWNHFKRIFRETYRLKKLRIFIIYSSIPIAFTLMGFWLNQRYFMFIDLPLYYFGIAISLISLSSGFASKFAREIEDYLGSRLSLAVIPFAVIIPFLLISQIKSVFVIFLMIFVSATWGFAMPIYNDFVQKLVSSDRRATVMSVMSLARRCIFFVLAPFIGWVADIYTVQTAYLVSTITLFILAMIALYGLKRVKII